MPASSGRSIEAGIAPGPDRVVAAHWGVRGGVLAMERLLTGANLPTAVFAESDEMAFGAMQAMRRSGLDVPGDVSLVGFDDHEMAAAADLTTIAQPVQLQGELAARLLLDALDGAEPGDVVLPTRLVVRGSTGPPRSRPAHEEDRGPARRRAAAHLLRRARRRGPRDGGPARPRPADLAASEIRYDPLLDEWVTIAAHRQGRTLPAAGRRVPAVPHTPGRPTEIPAADYDVVVFENRFPSLAAGPPRRPPTRRRDAACASAGPAVGRCEVVCFTSDHDASFARCRRSACAR